MAVPAKRTYPPRMKVALLTDSIDAHAPGFANYAMELADELARLLPELTLVHRGQDAYYDGRRHETYAVPGPAPLRRLLRQWTLPDTLVAGGYELVHDTYHFGPFLRRRRFARVLTIGDLTPLTTDSHARSNRWAHRLALPVIARRAHRIVTFSEQSKRDIVRLFGIDADRIAVTLLAANPRFSPLDGPTIDGARRRLGLPERYLLFVGSIEPRKNVERLIRGYERALPAIGDVRLVLASRRMWRVHRLPALLRELGLESRVLRRADIGQDDLPAVYGGALGLCYPSLYEGFGLPPLEAMQCGTPVLTSNTSSLPEVVGDAAIAVDPRSIDAIAAGIVELVTDDARRADLSRRGIDRARMFSWQRCARETAAAYDVAIQSRETGAR